LSETEAVIADDSQSSSTDKNYKPESDVMVIEENKCNLPMSQCQPLLLSQAGKFIPKFMAKKKMKDCIVKPAEYMPAESNNCSVPESETEVALEFMQYDSSSVADKVKDTNSACPNRMPSTDTGKENEPVFVERAVDNDTFIEFENVGVSDRQNDESERYNTTAEEKELNRMNVDVSGEIQQNINSASADQLDVKDSTELLHLLPPGPINITGSQTAENTPAVETVLVSDDVHCTEPEVSESVCREDSQPPLDTNEVMDDSKTTTGSSRNTGAGDNTTTAVLQTEVSVRDASKPDTYIPPVQNDRQPDPDAVPHDDDDGLEKLEMHDSRGAEGTSSKTAEAASVSGDIRASTAAIAAPASSAPAESANAEMSDDNKADTAVNEAGNLVLESAAELESFDDFLDLTDSQLCQLDDISIRYMQRSVQSDRIELN